MTSFRAILVVRRHAAVRAEGLLAPSSASLLRRQALSFAHAWRKGLGLLLSYPLLVATLCFNPAEGPQTASRSAECRPGVLPYVLAAGSTHTWRATERRLHFDSRTRTRVKSDSSVNDGYCFRLFSVDTSPSTYFSPFPSRNLPRSTRTMTDSCQLRSSISLLGNHAEFLPFAKHVSFEHSTGIPCPVISSRREGNIKQTDKTQKFLDTRSSICQSASRPRKNPALLSASFR